MKHRSSSGRDESFTYVYHRRQWLWLFKLVDGLGGRIHQPASGVPDLSRARSILVLKLDQIGDLVLTEPLLAQLKVRAPSARLRLVVGAERRQIAELIPECDEIFELPVRLSPRPRIVNLPAFFKAVKRLRDTRPEVIVTPKEDPLTVLLSWMLGAPIRIGFREGGLGFLLTHAVPVDPETPQFAVLAALSGLREMPEPPRLVPRDDDHRAATKMLEEFRLPLGLPVIVVHPGARLPEKQWPREAFIETMERMSREQPFAFLWVRDANTGNTNVNLDARSWLRELPTLELGVFAALLSRTDLLLGNDSAPAHIAAAVGTPVVVVFLSGENPRRWGPPEKDCELVHGGPGQLPTPEAVSRRCVDFLRGQRRVSTS